MPVSGHKILLLPMCMGQPRPRQTLHRKEIDSPRNFYSRSENVVHDPLVPNQNIYLPPFHIKLGLMKQFVKAMDKTGDGFNFLKTKFPRLSEAKIKEGVFVVPLD
ncbi:hypothetical protein AVEN_75408-1 [Araneus ventricosus]|uniref:Uncharacterized protein n=1 Tax=Araneus ventricosus TaxID=182803 RepID=A0A4Y2J885_ARAVE|nr:hypothetical protein AVEN_75408-1 [Araneus ventricosus]